MYVRINSHRAWDSLERHRGVEVVDYHYFTDKGIFHIQEIPDGTDLTGIKGVKAVKRMPKEKLHAAWKTGRK